MRRACRSGGRKSSRREESKGHGFHIEGGKAYRELAICDLRAAVICREAFGVRGACSRFRTAPGLPITPASWTHSERFALRFIPKNSRNLRACRSWGKDFTWRSRTGAVGSAVKLGRAVEHAGLAAYEDRRMEFAYRDRDQASFPASGNLGPGWLFRLRGARQSPE